MIGALWLAILTAVLVGSPTLAEAQLAREQGAPNNRVAVEKFQGTGYGGRVALVPGKVDPQNPTKSDKLFVLDDNTCYDWVTPEMIAAGGKLRFAVGHNVGNSPYRNAFLAAQIIRFKR